MDEVFKENYKESLVNAHRAFISSVVIGVFCFTLVGVKLEKTIKIPIIEMDFPATMGVLIVMSLYFVFGIQMNHFLRLASDNLSKIGSQELKNALLLWPSYFTGHFLQRLIVVLAPYAILAWSFYHLFERHLIAALIVSLIYSVFHLASIGPVSKLGITSQSG